MNAPLFRPRRRAARERLPKQRFAKTAALVRAKAADHQAILAKKGLNQ